MPKSSEPIPLFPDFFALLRALSAAKVKYLIVGAYALAWHGRQRYTKDLDLFVEASEENASRLFQALTAFGVPLQGIAKEDFCAPGCLLQIGVEPVRADILTQISGVDFADAWERRVPGNFGPVAVHVISREDFIRNKRASGRPADLHDVASLLP